MRGRRGERGKGNAYTLLFGEREQTWVCSGCILGSVGRVLIDEHSLSQAARGVLSGWIDRLAI